MQGPPFAVRWATVLLGKASEGGPGAEYYPVAPEPPGPSRGVFVASLACFAIVAGVLGGIVPHFALLYDSADVPMPPMTKALVDVSRLFVALWPLWTPLLILASWRLRRVRYAEVFLVLGMGFFAAFALVALFLPLQCTLGIGR
jgi:hypothetical protein